MSCKDSTTGTQEENILKINRLIGILSLLLQQEQMTASELAEKFEVSRRTINRDIEALCEAGIPLVTMQGKNGGVSIMEGYRLDKTLLTSGELQAILAGLKSLDSVSGTSRYRMLMEKLSCGTQEYMQSSPNIWIDLSSWYKASLSPKIELIDAAIRCCRQISFVYHSPKGDTVRCIEPFRLIFQWSSWYVWGWCLQRKDFRLFKLNRMTALKCTEQEFVKRPVPMPDLSPEKVFSGHLKVEAVFTGDCKWRLIEDFGIESFKERPDGSLYFSFEFSDMENALGWILTFGGRAEVLAPARLRKMLFETGKYLTEKYTDVSPDKK